MIQVKDLVPLSLGIKYDEIRETWIKLEFMTIINQYAVTRNSLCMSKYDGKFYYIPFERTEEFLETFRFKSAEEALETYLKFNIENNRQRV